MPKFKLANSNIAQFKKSMYQITKQAHNIFMKIVCSNCVVIILTATNIYDNIMTRKRDDYIMANLTSAINVNVDAQVKEEATIILKDLGLNMSTFINMALAQVVKRNGVPFEVVNPKPSKEMLQALAEVDDMIKNPDKYPSYDNWDDLKASLLSDD